MGQLSLPTPIQGQNVSFWLGDVPTFIARGLAAEGQERHVRMQAGAASQRRSLFYQRGSAHSSTLPQRYVAVHRTSALQICHITRAHLAGMYHVTQQQAGQHLTERNAPQLMGHL